MNRSDDLSISLLTTERDCRYVFFRVFQIGIWDPARYIQNNIEDGGRASDMAFDHLWDLINDTDA